MVRISNISGILVLLLIIPSMGCDTQEQQNDFAAQASLPPEGFTATTKTGDILDEDEDDWRTSPVYFGKVRVSPIFPNPAGVDFVTLPINILQFDAIRGGFTLRAHDASLSNFMLLDQIIDINGPGGFIMRFSPAVLGRNGLVRLFIFDASNEIVSYGDVLIGN